MLDGWYCRSMANQQSSSIGDEDTQSQSHQNNHYQHPQHHQQQQQHHRGMPQNDGTGGGGNDSGSGDDDSHTAVGTIPNINPRIDYKGQYNSLKKKLKFLLYENEYFQDALRSSQRRLLKVTRDRSFLIDRLLQYEKPEITSSESEDTESSEDDSRIDVPKRKKCEANSASVAAGSGSNNASTSTTTPSTGKTLNAPKRKKATGKKAIVMAQAISNNSNMPTIISDGHMTAEEVERHLQSRQPLIEMVPERAPATVPTEMFSNEPSLDSEDQLIETSPSNIGEDCMSVDMNIMQE